MEQTCIPNIEKVAPPLPIICEQKAKQVTDIVPEIDINNELEFLTNVKTQYGRTAGVECARYQGRLVAYKRFRYKVLTEHIKSLYYMELSLLIEMHNKCNNIVQLIAVSKEHNELGIVMEYIPYNLEQLRSRYIWRIVPFVTNTNHYNYAMKEALDLIRGLVNAVSCMHQHGYIHRDIKPHNILVNNNTWQVKLCDFGLCVYMHENIDLCGQRVGTSGYSAPEVMNGENYTFSADVFSIGVCMWSILCPGQTNPFTGLTCSKYYARMENGERLQFPERKMNMKDTLAWNKLVVLVKECWEFVPKARPNMNMLKDKIYDIDKIYNNDDNNEYTVI